MDLDIKLTNTINGEQQILAQFLYYAVFVPPNTPPPSPSIVHDPELWRYIEGWGKSDDHVVFAYIANTVVGACWSRCFPKERPGYGTITPEIPELSIAVLPEYRSKGIGSKLLSALIEDIKPHYPAVSLSVSTYNPAKALYERFGFKTIRTTSDSEIMVKEFNPASPTPTNQGVENNEPTR
jgi:GNAT superfamily N-acetyltransferase